VTPSCTDHIQKLNTLERRGTKNLTNLQPMRGIGTPKLSNETLRLTLSLGNRRSTRLLTTPTQRSHMTTLSTRRLASRPVIKTNLHSIVAVFFFRADLQHNARARLNDSNRDNNAISVIDLSHSNFSTKQPDRHSSAPARRKLKNANRDCPP
jgi:hypothetical protein